MCDCTKKCGCEEKLFTSDINYDGSSIPCLDVLNTIKPPYSGLNSVLNLIVAKLCELINQTPTFLNQYIEVLTPIELGVADPNWAGDSTWFIPTAYTSLTYTNNSGSTKDFLVDIRYSSGTSDIGAGEYGKSWVYSGLFLNTDLVNPIYDVEAKIQINEGSAAAVYAIGQHNSYMKKVTLANGEGVTVQFKTKGIGDGYLRKAQMFVKEL